MRFNWLRRALVGVIGFTVLFVGVAMLVLPGPAILMIPAGLTILATEFVWASRLLARTRAKLSSQLSGTKQPEIHRGGQGVKASS